MADISAILQLVNLALGESSYGSDTNWGDVTDRNFGRIEKALGEVTSKTLTGSDVTLSADEELSSTIKLSGTLSANVAVETSGRKGFWLVSNACTGDFTVTFKTDAGTGVVIPQGGKAIVASDGTDMLPIAVMRANGAGARTKYSLKSTGFTAAPSDDGAFFECSAALTMALKPAALLADQWTCIVRANGGAVTVDPNASELINGAATISIPDGSFAIIICTGTAFRAVLATSITAAQASMQVAPWIPLSTDSALDPDMDTYLTPGWQHRVEFTTDSIAHAPPQAGIYHAQVLKTNDTRLTQVLIPYSSIITRNIWVRNIAGAAWGAWRSLPWSDEVVLKAVDTLLTAGYTATAGNDGTKSTGTYTPSPAGGNLKRIVNGGAFSLAAPSASGDYTMVIQITNNASAGAITLSGFSKTDGDPFTTTNGHDFFVFIVKINGFTHATVVKLQ